MQCFKQINCSEGTCLSQTEVLLLISNRQRSDYGGSAIVENVNQEGSNMKQHHSIVNTNTCTRVLASVVDDESSTALARTRTTGTLLKHKPIQTI